jgi:hypothetical protein
MSPKFDELLRVRVTSLLAHMQRNLIRGGDQNGWSSNNCLGMCGILRMNIGPLPRTLDPSTHHRRMHHLVAMIGSDATTGEAKESG